jgi:hypothetical protein
MFDQLIGPITGLLDKFIEDKDQKARLAHDLATMAQKHAQELAKAQLDVNKTEAAHKSMFVAGWRPAVGWVCCIGLGSNYLFIPMANFVLVVSGSDITVPALDLSEMMPVLMGMLGLGVMRSYEKVNNVARER